MTTLDFIDVCNILETLFNTDNIDLIWYEQNANFLFIEALIDGNLKQMNIDVKTKEIASSTGSIEINTEKKG